jgi:hypothetical protein
MTPMKDELAPRRKARLKAKERFVRDWDAVATWIKD